MDEFPGPATKAPVVPTPSQRLEFYPLYLFVCLLKWRSWRVGPDVLGGSGNEETLRCFVDCRWKCLGQCKAIHAHVVLRQFPLWTWGHLSGLWVASRTSRWAEGARCFNGLRGRCLPPGSVHVGSSAKAPDLWQISQDFVLQKSRGRGNGVWGECLSKSGTYGKNKEKNLRDSYNSRSYVFRRGVQMKTFMVVRCHFAMLAVWLFRLSPLAKVNCPRGDEGVAAHALLVASFQVRLYLRGWRLMRAREPGSSPLVWCSFWRMQDTQHPPLFKPICGLPWLMGGTLLPLPSLALGRPWAISCLASSKSHVLQATAVTAVALGCWWWFQLVSCGSRFAAKVSDLAGLRTSPLRVSLVRPPLSLQVASSVWSPLPLISIALPVQQLMRQDVNTWWWTSWTRCSTWTLKLNYWNFQDACHRFGRQLCTPRHGLRRFKL